MRKAAVLLASLLIAISSLSAGSWQMGAEAGYTMGFYDQRGGWREGRSYSLGHAFEVAVPVEYRANEWLSISSGIRYIGKSYGMSNTYEFQGETVRNMDIRNTEHFFEIPLTFRLSLGNGSIRGFIGAGGYVGVRFMSVEKGKADLAMTPASASEIWRMNHLNPETDNLFDAGIIAEAGLGYAFQYAGELYLAARYQYSLTALDRKYQQDPVGRYIDTLSITLGYSFRLGGEA